MEIKKLPPHHFIKKCLALGDAHKSVKLAISQNITSILYIVYVHWKCVHI